MVEKVPTTRSFGPRNREHAHFGPIFPHRDILLNTALKRRQEMSLICINKMSPVLLCLATLELDLLPSLDLTS